MKKLLIFCAVLLISTALQAKIYYISATGNDANAGTSTALPWQSIAKLNAMWGSIQPGDSILFKKGETFYGSIVALKSGASGKNIFIGSYGTGAKPILTGFTTLTSFTSLGSDIYKKNVPTAKAGVRLVAINGQPQRLARYPNESDGNGGYINYSLSTSTTNIIDTNHSILNKVGATVVVRPVAWAVEANIITAISGDTMKFRIGRGINACCVSPLLYAKKPGYGYFYQNDASFIDEDFEWVLDSTTKDFKMKYPSGHTPSEYTVQIATLDTGINLGSRQYFTINGLSFIGYGMSAIFNANGSNVNVLDCDFNLMGAKGIHFYNTANVNIIGGSANYCLSNAVQASSKTKNYATIADFTVKNTAPFVGMDSWFDDADGVGIYGAVSQQLLIQNCRVDSSGKTAINFQGNYVTILNCLVNYYMYNYCDRGGVYTWASGTDAAPGPYYTNRLVKNCVVKNGIGQKFGTTLQDPALAAIYLDGRTMNADVIGNTVESSQKNGIHSNNPNNVTIRDNTIYNCRRPISFMRWAWGSISNFNIKANTIFNLGITDYSLFYTNAALNGISLSASLASVGLIDSNYYGSYNEAAFGTEVYVTEGGAYAAVSPMGLDAWRSISGKDLNSKVIKPVTTYKINSTTGSNKVPNGDFASNVTGWAISGGSPTFTWMGGKGRMQILSPVKGSYTQLHRAVGSIDNSKKYVVRITTNGTGNGFMRCRFRNQTGFATISDVQLKYFGIGTRTLEYLFTGITTVSNANLLFEIEQASGTTDVDNIELYECTATQYNVSDSVIFYANGSANPYLLNFTGKKFLTAKGTSTLQNSVTVPAWGAFLGIWNGSAIIQQNKITIGKKVYKKI